MLIAVNSVSIPQRSDLNDYAKMFAAAGITVSIPQRSDLNSSSHHSHTAGSCVSIPQRSDLNKSRMIGLLDAFAFQSRNGLI